MRAKLAIQLWGDSLIGRCFNSNDYISRLRIREIVPVPEWHPTESVVAIAVCDLTGVEFRVLEDSDLDFKPQLGD